MRFTNTQHGSISQAPRRSGHTLLELMVALPLLALLAAAAGYTITVTSRAQLLNEGLLRDKLASIEIAARLTEELSMAISLAEHTDHAVEFSIADRDGDGDEEILRYEWSGVAGDPLQFTYNADDPLTLAEDVHAFELDYQLQTPGLLEGEDGLSIIKYHDDAKKGKMKDFKIEALKWCAQYFEPALPGDATTWELNKVRLMAKKDGDLDGVVKVRITTATGGQQPTPTVLEEFDLPEVDLDKKHAWITAEFYTLKNLDPDDGLCIVLAYGSGTDKVGKFRFEQNGLNMPLGTHYMESEDGGATWSSAGTDEDLRFYVFGQHDGTETTRTFATLIKVGVQLGDDTQVRVDTGVSLLNGPEVSVP